MTQINQNYKRKFQILLHLFKTENRKQKTEIENKISSISGLATNSALIAVENKIRNVSSLVKKKKQIVTQQLVKLKRHLLIIIMTSILLLQNLIIQQQVFLMQD